jgi:hypothetical protein
MKRIGMRYESSLPTKIRGLEVVVGWRGLLL